MALVAGLTAAFLSAFGTNLAFLLRHRGAVESPDVDVKRPIQTVIDLFKSRAWLIGSIIALGAFACHVVALALLDLSLAQAVLASGFVLLAVLAERYFGFSMGKRQWAGVTLVTTALVLLAVTGGGGGKSDYAVSTMILFEAVVVLIGLVLVFSHRTGFMDSWRGIMLGAAAGLGFGVADIAIKAATTDIGTHFWWLGLAAAMFVFSFYASARSLQTGEGVAVIAVTSVAANFAAIIAGVIVFQEPLGENFLEVCARIIGFVLVLAGAALMPAPTRAVAGGEERDREQTAPAGVQAAAAG